MNKALAPLRRGFAYSQMNMKHSLLVLAPLLLAVSAATLGAENPDQAIDNADSIAGYVIYAA